jgi:hypothetical protein
MNAWLVRIGSVLVLAAIGFWLVSATEWADTEIPTPASGEAKKNSFYGAQVMLRELGVQVVKHDSLDTMPPAQARLVLASSHWDMFPEREQRLRQWVEQGGHLVMPSHLVNSDLLEGWIPLVREKPPAGDEKKESKEPSGPSPKPCPRASPVAAASASAPGGRQRATGPPTSSRRPCGPCSARKAPKRSACRSAAAPSP